MVDNLNKVLCLYKLGICTADKLSFLGFMAHHEKTNILKCEIKGADQLRS